MSNRQTNVEMLLSGPGFDFSAMNKKTQDACPNCGWDRPHFLYSYGWGSTYMCTNCAHTYTAASGELK